MATRGAHKDIQVSARVDGDTSEQIDQLARLQNCSQAEIVRRAVHLLAATCQVGHAGRVPHLNGRSVWPTPDELAAFDARSRRGAVR